MATAGVRVRRCERMLRDGAIDLAMPTDEAEAEAEASNVAPFIAAPACSTRMLDDGSMRPAGRPPGPPRFGGGSVQVLNLQDSRFAARAETDGTDRVDPISGSLESARPIAEREDKSRSAKWFSGRRPGSGSVCPALLRGRGRHPRAVAF
ncbi:hypothetical protein GUJ93_ZPchr0006g44424 [Zizania palustris]|uniref:Uncharacterized protein n=1 Tax=Zizania palustris TaxID=103762 RepID=A0A8J5SFR4_ZIZPA|nr:hypothetical protein GUJ93_ZPchr0006g44424 [Zizania palustris]